MKYLQATKHRMANYVFYEKKFESHKQYLAKLINTIDPTNFKQATKDKVWISAMKNELNALKKNEIWDVTSLPIGKRPIGCKWIYKTKRNLNGSINKHKARLLAKGYTQVQGIDYNETFTSVSKMTTFRTILSLATTRGWHTHQMDLQNVFLHGTLDEEIYMTIPQGLGHIPYDIKNPICRLKKSLYGLKQTSRVWYNKLSTTLKNLGFKQCKSDYSLFIKKSQSSTTIILAYVDDLLIAGNDIQHVQRIKKHLHGHFNISDLGELKYFLGLEITKTKNGLHVGQHKYALDIIKSTNLTDSKPTPTPCTATKHQNKDITNTDKPCHRSETPLEDPQVYRSIVGKLVYLTVTRPDITYAVNSLSQNMSKPTNKDMQAVHI